MIIYRILKWLYTCCSFELARLETEREAARLAKYREILAILYIKYMHVCWLAYIKFCCHAEFLGWHDLKKNVRRHALRRRQSLLYVNTSTKMHDFEIVQQKYHSKTLYIYQSFFDTLERTARNIPLIRNYNHYTDCCRL
jgi:hypothetical protein